MPGKRVCFISSRRGHAVNGEKVQMDWANGRLISKLSETFGGLSLAFFGDEGKGMYDFSFGVRKVHRFPLPFSYLAAFTNSWSFIRVLRRIERENDVLIVQLPNIAFIAFLFIRKPCVFHVCANVLTASRNPFKYAGMKAIPARAFSAFMHSVFLNLFSRPGNRLIVNGSELGTLYKKYQPRVVISSSLFSSEIISKDELRPRDGKFNILFIGRPSLEKGFPTLLKAFHDLLETGRDAMLHLVGFTKEEFKRICPEEYAFAQQHLDKMVFHGFVVWGDEFRSIVRSNHVMLFCSVSEGTPRVIIESRALGCPVIATRVGGVIDSVKNEVDGFLVAPQNSSAMVEIMIRLYDDEAFRMEIAGNGIQRVKHLTIENFSNAFKDSIKEIVNE